MRKEHTVVDAPHLVILICMGQLSLVAVLDTGLQVELQVYLNPLFFPSARYGRVAGRLINGGTNDEKTMDLTSLGNRDAP
jgi:hypothetical protein